MHASVQTVPGRYGGLGGGDGGGGATTIGTERPVVVVTPVVARTVTLTMLDSSVTLVATNAMAAARATATVKLGSSGPFWSMMRSMERSTLPAEARPLMRQCGRRHFRGPRRDLSTLRIMGAFQLDTSPPIVRPSFTTVATTETTLSPLPEVMGGKGGK
jgi:hypothetical protein